MTDQATRRRSRASAPRPAARATADYHDSVLTLAERIRGNGDVSAIVSMLHQTLAEMRPLITPELAAARRRIDEAELSMGTMRNELEQVKALLRQDPLTGTLNRRGIDDAFGRRPPDAIAMALGCASP